VNPADADVIVTGGASGLGRGVVQELYGRGATVVILDLAGSDGAAVAEQLGERADFVACDVTDADAVESAWQTVTARHDRIDCLVSCAGILRGRRLVGRDGELHSLEEFRRHLDVNVVGMFDVMRRAVASMTCNEPNAEGERGLVVNLASIAAFEGQIGQAAYSASKGAVVAMTLPLARELGRSGIRVVAIAPGTMDTPMLGTLTDEAREAFSATMAFPQRLGRPDDVGRLVCAVMENVYVNGSVIRLDAGLRMSAR
jgi:NAD(P)-dependent dehydrogenase (short-subunit alcohol dehydrogenase family)